MDKRPSAEREDGPGGPPPAGTPRGERDGSPARPGAVVFIGLGVMDALLVGLGMAGGWAIDSHLGTSPLFVLVGLALGVVLCVLATYTEIKKYL